MSAPSLRSPAVGAARFRLRLRYRVRARVEPVEVLPRLVTGIDFQEVPMFGRSSLRYPEPAQQVDTTEWTILATAEPDRFGNFEYVTWVEDIILANWRDQGFRYHHSEPAEWGGFSSVWQHDDTRTHTCTLRRKCARV